MPKRTGRPWQRRKARIIRRDNGICHLCGEPGADSADHLIPHDHGGPDHDTNLAAVHHDTGLKCNRIRGNRSIEEARQHIALERQRQAHDAHGWRW